MGKLRLKMHKNHPSINITNHSTDDSEFLKLRDLQEDVVNMRKSVPEEIAKLMDRHSKMLKIRRV